MFCVTEVYNGLLYEIKKGRDFIYQPWVAYNSTLTRQVDALCE